MIDCTELKTQTRDYWGWKPRDYDRYIREILPSELDCAQKTLADDGLPRLQGLDKSINTLAFTVGDSLEPLLQSVCVLQPRRVALILNRAYSGQSGKARGKQLQRLIASLSKTDELSVPFRPDIDREDVIPYEIDTDTPTQVFRALQSAFSDENALVSDEMLNVVDITGAKKSMVVGAFLYAAHSELPITYVDFDADAYDPDWRRPYGFLCKIRPIPNPYEAFGLRDWERVRQLYERYDFRGARELLGKAPTQDCPGSGILGIMAGHLEGQSSGPPLYDESDIQKVCNLAMIFEMYEAWDGGNYGLAFSLQQTIPDMPLPDAITKLGSNWFQVSANGIDGGPDDFYANLNKLTVYAVDELKRIDRLIRHNQDYRSAFLRAGGLNEVIMTARLMELEQDSQIRRQLFAALRQGTPGIGRLFYDLTQPSGHVIRLGKIGLRNAPKTEVTLVNPMHNWWSVTKRFSKINGWEGFLKIRNSLAHKYVSVPHDIAEDALLFVRSNIEDFIGTRTGGPQVQAEAVRWTELCAFCNLTFLPPLLRT